MGVFVVRLIIAAISTFGRLVHLPLVTTTEAHMMLRLLQCEVHHGG